MKSRVIQLIFAGFFLLTMAISCEKEKNTLNFPAGSYIADYTIASEDFLRSIPTEYINMARNNLHVAYQHTSHGTHVAYGLFGLQDYKPGDRELFGITNNEPTENKLDFHDYALSAYAEPDVDAADLSRDETAFIQATRNYLDDPQNADINVVMWSWCDIAGHDVSQNYLPGMQTLISEYSIGGSKIGSDGGQRLNPVTFIFMTGHANEGNNAGEGNPKSQSELITSFCKQHRQFCLDYYSIDTHDMNDNYWEDTGDNGNSAAYGGNFYLDWQNNHMLGADYFENKSSPDGDVTFGEHNSQHITANRKAYTMWYILACIAGYNPGNNN